MKQEALVQFPLQWISIAAMLIFFISFLAIAMKTYKFKANHQHQEDAQLVLEQEPESRGLNG